MIPEALLFKKDVDREIKHDKMKTMDRVGQVISLVFVFLFIGYFYAHYSRDTGFFTPGFSVFDAFIFYLPVAIGFIPTFIRLLIGRKNPARLFDIVNNVVIIVALSWFLASWPFDFSHFATPLPAWLEPAASWISDGIMKLLAVLAIPLLLFVDFHEAMVYIGVKEGLETQPAAQPEPNTQPKEEEKKP